MFCASRVLAVSIPSIKVNFFHFYSSAVSTLLLLLLVNISDLWNRKVESRIRNPDSKAINHVHVRISVIKRLHSKNTEINSYFIPLKYFCISYIYRAISTD